MKKIVVVVILILSLLLVTSPAYAAGVTVTGKTGDGVWVGNTWKVDIYPGETKSTVLTLRNSSSSSLDVEVSVLPSSLDNGNLTFGLNKTEFTMSGRSYANVVLSVEASGSATPGIYTTDFTIKFEEPYSSPSWDTGGTTRYLKVDLWGEDFKTRVTSDGEVKVDLEAVSDDGVVTLYITKGVIAQTRNEFRLSKIVVSPMEEAPPAPKNVHIIGTVYDFTPVGATFDPFIELEIEYNSSQLPDDVNEKDLLIACYDEDNSKWLELDSVVYTRKNTVTAEIDYLTSFAIIGYEVIIAPAAFTISGLVVSPTEVNIGQVVTINAIVTNTGGKTGIYEVVLKVDGVVEATREVMVSAGASKKVSFFAAKDVAGSWEVDVNGLSGLLTVRTPLPPVTPTSTPPPLVPPIVPEPETPWGLIGSIIGGLFIAGGFGYWFWQRKRKARW